MEMPDVILESARKQERPIGLDLDTEVDEGLERLEECEPALFTLAEVRHTQLCGHPAQLLKRRTFCGTGRWLTCALA